MHLKANSPAVAHHGKTVIGFNWIGGKELEGDLPSFDSKSAVDTRDTVGIFPECGERDVEKAAKAAALAFPSWSAAPVALRCAMIGRIGAGLAKHQTQLAAIITREVGKPPREALREVQEAIDACSYFQSEAQRLQADPEGAGRRRPLGVCAILAGSNCPLAVPTWKIIPAIAFGNTVVWKPSVDAPTTAYLLIRCMMDAGLPPGVVNVVNGKGRTGCGKFFVAAIDKGFYQKFSFTGATAMGRTVGEMAGRNLMVSSLELGGKNPMIVMPDCRLEDAVQGALRGAFGNAGQLRTSLANILVHQDLADAFRTRFLAAVNAMPVGNPVTDPDVFYGPLINPRLGKAFEEHWAVGREEGARLLCGGARWTEDNRTAQVKGFITKGIYMQPCVWDQVTPAMRLFQTEVFGPTVNLLTVDSFDQAMELANGTAYGLTSSIYTESREWVRRFRRESNAGTLFINACAADARAHLALGGTGWSGNGTREAGRAILDGYTRWQSIQDGAARPAEPSPETFAGTSYEPSHWDLLSL